MNDLTIDSLINRFKLGGTDAELVQLVDKIAVCQPKEAARDAVKDLIENRVFADSGQPKDARQPINDGLIPGAVWMTGWRSRAYHLLIHNLCAPDESLVFVGKIATENKSSDRRIEALQMLAEHFPDHPEAFKFLVRSADSEPMDHVRAYALRSIIKFFPHCQEARPYLMQAAEILDDPMTLQPTALEMLGKHHAAFPETRKFLERLVVDKEISTTRRSGVKMPEWMVVEQKKKKEVISAFACHALVSAYPHDNDVYEMAARKVQEVEDPRSARPVFSAFMKTYRDKPEAALAIIEKARKGAHPHVRDCALTALYTHGADEHQVRAFLLERAVDDEDRWPRVAAVSGLAERFSHDGEAITMIATCYADDPSDVVREHAATTISRHFRNNEVVTALIIDCFRNEKNRKPSQALAKVLENFGGNDPAVRRALLRDKLQFWKGFRFY